MNNDLTTLSERITDSLRPKFKVGQQVVCIMSKENITKDSVYVVDESYVCSSNIPCVAVIGDNGKLQRCYQTYFKAADLSKFDVKMSEKDAIFILEEVIDECHCDDFGDFYLSNTTLIDRIRKDKELQKALLVLIGEGK